MDKQRDGEMNGWEECLMLEREESKVKAGGLNERWMAWRYG